MDRAKERVVFDPPCLLTDERLELARASGIVTPLVGAEPLKRGPQRRALHPTDAGVIDVRGAPQHVEQVAIGGRQRRFPTDGRKLRHVRHANVHRIDGHGAHGRVRRGLARRPLVDRQELKNFLTRAREPARQRHEIADIAGAPARGGRAGKQRDQQA